MAMLRRTLLATTGLGLLMASSPAFARVVAGGLPWAPGASAPPRPVAPGGWQFFTPEEATAVEALVDRLIPPEEEWAGGKDAGCAVFIDRQLAGPYGRSEGLYMRPPFAEAHKGQGEQSPLTPAERYRRGLAQLDKYCRDRFAGKGFAELGDEMKDQILGQLEKGPIAFEGVSAQGFFSLLLTNTKEGFFADPVHGGNRNMVAWRMIGFPGVRYDFRDWVERHNERYPLPPVSIVGRPEWGRG